MALIHCDFFSNALQLSTSIIVILPQPDFTRLQRGASRRFPVLYLLHGLSDDHTIWQRRTSIERYVEGLDLAVVMPAVNRSFYTNMAFGNRYWTFVSEELPKVVRGLFPISTRREDTYVAGLSMGGYGAFKLALTYPERYAAAASLSGALDIVSAAKDMDPAWQAELKLIFGDPKLLEGSAHCLLELSTRLVAEGGPRPALFQCCGMEDPLIAHNRRFKQYADKIGLKVVYYESPGEHEWGYWDEHIQAVLKWLPLKKRISP